MKKNFTTNAIVLKRRNYSESDRILTILTADQGKFDVLAKGVRKTKSRKRGHIELFTHLQAHIIETKWIPLLTQANSLNQFHLHPQQNYQEQSTKLHSAYHLAEITDRLLPESDPQPEIYDYLLKSFHYIQNSNPDLPKLHKSYKLKILQQLGYWPESHEIPTDIDNYIHQILEKPLKTAAYFQATLT